MEGPAIWTEQDVRAFLGGYGRRPLRLKVEQLQSWWFNVVLRVEAEGGRLVLRRYGVTPPEEVRWELAVLDHLHKHDFPTFAPLSRTDGPHDRLGEFLGKPAILYPFIEGRQGCEIDWSLAVAQTAQVVARLHELTEGLAVPHPRVRSGTESRRIVRQLIDYAAKRGVSAQETALLGLLEQAERTLDHFEARIAPYVDALPHGVVHHDAHCQNALFRGDRLVALIDFDDAHYGFQVADLAVMITNWADDRGPGDPLNLQKAVAVVQQYERHRRLTDAERELLPDFVLLYLLCDTAEYVRCRLERGADGNTAVGLCNVYRCYLHHAHDAGWSAAFRQQLSAAAT